MRKKRKLKTWVRVTLTILLTIIIGLILGLSRKESTTLRN